MTWTCPVCAGQRGTSQFKVASEVGENGVDSDAFRPSSSEYGRAVAQVVRCDACGHGTVAELPSSRAMSVAYAGAVDDVSLREEPGQVATADRDLAGIERFVEPGRLLDIGCWTGSFLEAARRRGWEPVGVEPARWACERARARGLEVHCVEVADVDLPPASFRAVVACDVLEHLHDPGEAVHSMTALLEPGGLLFVTVPDAGSTPARVLGRRWWSVLPMHLQYFTRKSITRLLSDQGLIVEDISTHAKVFSLRYYAERLGGYSRTAERVTIRVLERTGTAERLVAPNLRDRIAAIAHKR